MAAAMDAFCQVHFTLLDTLRRAQGNALGALGLGPAECDYRVLASGPHWRLRAYGAARRGPPVLIVAAPIKRPYIWDVAPTRSAIRYCLNEQLSVYLLEWLSPASGQGGAGLDAYAGEAISECRARALRDSGGEQPFLMGHSLGGTLAAIHAALNPQGVRGLVLLGAPLCFQPGCKPISRCTRLPGSLWAVGHRRRARLSPLAGERARLSFHVRLVAADGRHLYREDRFCRGTLAVCGREVGPSGLRLPTLMVVNVADEIAPPASVSPLAQAMPAGAARVLEYPGETGVGLQHLAILVGRQAYAHVWPEIVSWIKATADLASSRPLLSIGAEEGGPTLMQVKRA